MKSALARKSKIFVIDDHPVVRQGLRQLILQTNDLEVVGDADDAGNACLQLEKLKVDLIVLDLTLKRSSGMTLIKKIKILQPKTPIVVLTMHDKAFYAQRVMKAGASGFVSKEEPPEDLLKAIRKVLVGEMYLCQEIAKKFLTNYIRGENLEEQSLVQRLTDREVEIMELFGKGNNTRQIGTFLNVSIKTVESHRENIKLKLNLNTSTDLIRFATRWVNSEEFQPS